MTGTIDHIRSTHEVSPVRSDAIHANAHAATAMSTVRTSGDMERPYREDTANKRTPRTIAAIPRHFGMTRSRDRCSRVAAGRAEGRTRRRESARWFPVGTDWLERGTPLACTRR